ncbi:MAG: hypothetical protein JSW51_01995 [Gemmatimonadota bacterium]|nr:MAG: hypothetical protein JSW51_01995 [Gemmatimonadota bacterium]
MDFKLVLREGFIAGLIGAAAVAGWFLIVDVVAGQPFYTPAVLGQALFWGLTDPAMAEVTFPAVVAYTMVHVLAFQLWGILAALLACQVERFPATLFVVVVLFAVYEFGFYIIVATLAQPLLGALAWTNVAISNAVAAFGMGYYLWHAHPRLRETLKQQPLGATTD